MVLKISSFDLEICEESRNLLDMGAYSLVYDKRPLMVR
jgi:hypothetical protein